MAFTDCTEQPIPRPNNNAKNATVLFWKKKEAHNQEFVYDKPEGSGKCKTRHNQMGNRHDYWIYKDKHPRLPNEVMSMFDLGFLGVKKDFPELKSLISIKREKGCELPDMAEKRA